MKIKNVETMLRAIGIIEGIYWCATDQKLADALIAVVEMLDAVVESEAKDNDRT